MSKKKCFVIMPFSKTTENHDKNYWNTFFNIIKSIMENNGYICSRSETGPYSLMTNIIKNLNESDIVVAVLTDLNANVWYELGVRHTLKIGTIMLMQEGQKVPFDINSYGIIFYQESLSLEKELTCEIEKYLKKLDSQSSCDSPVWSAVGNLKIVEKLFKQIINEVPQEHIKTERNRVGRRLLWVDDYPANNDLLISYFTDKNIKVDIAVSTDQGIKLFKENHYDLVITDMGRGTESKAGIQLIKQLKEFDTKVPIIVYASPQAIRNYGEEAISLGASKTLFGVSNILSLVSTILNI